MREQGADLTDAQKRAVSQYLGTATPAAAATTIGKCTATPLFDPSKGPRWTGWSTKAWFRAATIQRTGGLAWSISPAKAGS